MKVNDLLLVLSISYSIKLQVTRACSLNMKQAPEITKSIQTTKNKSRIKKKKILFQHFTQL